MSLGSLKIKASNLVRFVRVLGAGLSGDFVATSSTRLSVANSLWECLGLSHLFKTSSIGLSLGFSGVKK